MMVGLFITFTPGEAKNYYGLFVPVFKAVRKDFHFSGSLMSDDKCLE